MPKDEKECKRCGRSLPLSFFSKQQKAKDRLDYWCRQCRSEYKQEWSRKNEGFRDKRKNDRKLYNRQRQKTRPNFWNIYKRTHEWVRKTKPNQNYCSICNEVKDLELANISGKYQRNIYDYMWVCKSCHRLFDRINKTHEVVVIG